MAETLEARLKRLLLLVPYVIGRPGTKVREVCAHFDISRTQLVSDLNLLFVCGLPGYGPGELIEAFIDGDQVVIRMADYFARPLKLTAAEGLILYCGAKALKAAGAASESLEKALDRLEKVLGPDVLGRVDVELLGTPDLALIRRSLTENMRLHITYYAHSKDETTERDVDPWALFASAGRWYLVGWCHRVEDERIFRVDRIRNVQILEQPAQVPKDVDLSKYEALYLESAGSIEVVLDLDPDHARWVGEYYPLRSQQVRDDGWVRVRLSAGGTAWLETLLLRLGGHARVIEPKSLQEKVKQLACAMVATYQDN